MNATRYAFFTFSLASLLLCGCSFGGKSTPTHFFVLDSSSPADAPAVVSGEFDDLKIGILDIRLPGYLNRNNLTSREGEHRLLVDENNRWAEPLSEGLQRILAERLMLALPGSQVVDDPWSRPHTPDVVVSVSVFEFEVQTSREEATLSGILHFYKGESRDLMAARDFQLSNAVSQSDAEAKAAALSRLGASLGDLIAAEITKSR